MTLEQKEWARKTAAKIAETIHDARGLSRYGATVEAREIIESRLAVYPEDAYERISHNDLKAAFHTSSYAVAKAEEQLGYLYHHKDKNGQA